MNADSIWMQHEFANIWILNTYEYVSKVDFNVYTVCIENFSKNMSTYQLISFYFICKLFLGIGHFLQLNMEHVKPFTSSIKYFGFSFNFTACIYVYDSVHEVLCAILYLSLINVWFMKMIPTMKFYGQCYTCFSYIHA